MHSDFRRNLLRSIEPASIAIVGASARAGSFGRRTLENLAGFQGRLHLVSATASAIDGRPCFPNVGALPEIPDCVVVAVPRDACEAVVLECAAVGVGGVVLYTSGFSETGEPAYKEIQERIASIAAGAGMALFGPNCLGVVNYVSGAVMSFINWPAAQPLAPHSLGLISQSGSLGLALAQAAQRGVSFSHVLTYGNAAGLDAADLIDQLADRKECGAIVCVVESSRDPRRLALAVSKATTKGKPVVFQKIASTDEGARAALSHTGSLAGGQEAYRALMESAGAIWIEDFEALVETASFFVKAPPPSARGVAVIGGSGGGGIMSVDKAYRHGVSLPQPTADTKAELQRHIPIFGAARNPCDVTAQVVSNPASLAACCDALAVDNSYGAIVSTQTVAAPEFVQRLPIYEASARASEKPVCTVWMSEWHEGPGAVEFERSERVALFRSVDRCFAAIRRWHDRADRLKEAATPMSVLPSVRSRLREMMATAPAGMLSERLSKALLTLYDIPVSEDRFVTDLDAAQDVARDLGFPVVLKVEADGLAHKSDSGGVQVNLKNAQELAAAWHGMAHEIRVRAPEAVVRGYVVSRMLHGDIEVLIGGRCDSRFGPLVTVGMGGVLVEVMNDVVSAAAPVNADQALRMLQSLRGAKLFDGFRSRSPINVFALAEIISRASQIIADGEGLLAELDVNPVLCGENGIWAVDALAIRSPETTQLPELGDVNE